ncbi:MAG: YfcE family phosphodiesterase [Thermoprotei archaeon]
MYILVIGDTHIPDRADRIPSQLLEAIESGKPWDIAVFTGDFTGKEVLEWFKKLGREIHYVTGNMDYLPLPRTRVFNADNIRFGVHHGDGVYPRGNPVGLTRIASSLGVDVLLTGHTHSPFIKHGTTRNILLVNPGSLTGVWGGGGGSMKPSMMIIEVSNDKLSIEHYELEHGRLRTRRIVVIKKDNEWILPS